MWCIMKVEKVNSLNNWQKADPKNKSVTNYCTASRGASVAFQGGPRGLLPAGASKRIKLVLRNLANAMSEITEAKNAYIAAIGTGIIAPAIILVSPGKGDKEDKDKKFLQALRQPLSAGLALSFQLPVTYGINKSIDWLGYEKKIKLFKDDVIGDLIPTEKYLAKQVTKEELAALEAKFDEVVNGQSLRQELEAKIQEVYDDVELDISKEKLDKKVAKKKEKFLREKIAKRKIEEIKNQKVQEFLANPKKCESIGELDLVNEDYQNRAEKKFKADFEKLKQDANLSWYDKLIETLGFETKKTKKLKDAQDELKKVKGLEILKQEKPEIFTDPAKRIKSYIDAYQKEANKFFGNKKFFISLFVNLFMVTASCYALNWIHPKVNKYIEERRAQKNNENSQKVEVK